jgi:hypothetical protein
MRKTVPGANVNKSVAVSVATVASEVDVLVASTFLQPVNAVAARQGTMSREIKRVALFMVSPLSFCCWFLLA